MRFEVSVKGEKPRIVTVERELLDNSVRFLIEIPDLNFKTAYALLKVDKEEEKIPSDFLFLRDQQERVIQVELLEQKTRSVTFFADGRVISAELRTGGSARGAGSTAPSTSIAEVGENVVSNFPARVVKVNVTRGEKMNEGDTLIVVEAMKMEAQIKAPKPCTVREVFVAEGDRVEKGKLLARLSF